MKIISGNKQIYLLRFDTGEEVVSGLAAFCNEHSIFAGSFSAIGAAGEIIISYYNLDTKAYQDKTIQERLEVISLLGNAAAIEGKVAIHMHGSFSGPDYTVRAGHVKKLVVSATCEITLQVFEGKIERSFDEKTGLNLLKE